MSSTIYVVYPKGSFTHILVLGWGNPQVLEQLNLESVSLPSSLLSLYGIST